MKIIVIIPTYNEKLNIEKMLPTLENDVFPRIKNHDMHVLVADDSSPDGTAEVVENNMKKWKNLHILKGKKEGLGAAYARAMQYAMTAMHADAVVEFDADFQHDPNDIPRLVAAVDEGYDYIIGSRYISGGQIPKEWGFDRKVKSIGGSLLARIVLFTFGIHDMTSGFKLTKTSFLKHVDLDNLYSKNYAYKMQILYEVVKLGAKVKEVPIIFYERTKGKSKMDTNDLFESLQVIFRLRLRDSSRIIKFLIVGGTGFLVQVLFQESSYRSGLTHSLAGDLASFNIITDIVAVSNFLAAAIGAEAAIISNFMFNNFWTFKDARDIEQKSPFFIRAFRFNIASFGSILLQSLAVLLGVKVFGANLHVFSLTVPTRIAILVPTIILIVIPLNYFIYNVLIWKTHHLKHAKKTSHKN